MSFGWLNGVVFHKNLVATAAARSHSISSRPFAFEPCVRLLPLHRLAGYLRCTPVDKFSSPPARRSLVLFGLDQRNDNGTSANDRI